MTVERSRSLRGSIRDFVARDYLPNTIDAITGKGQTWGIPSEVDVYMLVYNKLLLERAGLSEPPKTIEEFVADAARISKSNRQGQLTTSGFGVGLKQAQIIAPFLTLFYSNGGILFTPGPQANQPHQRCRPSRSRKRNRALQDARHELGLTAGPVSPAVRLA